MNGIYFLFNTGNLQRHVYCDVKLLRKDRQNRFSNIKDGNILVHSYISKTQFKPFLLSKAKFNGIVKEEKKKKVPYGTENTPTSKLVQMAQTAFSKSESDKYSAAWFEKEKNDYMDTMKKSLNRYSM